MSRGELHEQQNLCRKAEALLQDVAVSVVGKYKYTMVSPREHATVPVIVDIILVGRTKIITLHSALWLHNETDRRVAFRLHVPITPLTAPQSEAARNSSTGTEHGIGTDSVIGPLAPGEGAPHQQMAGSSNECK